MIIGKLLLSAVDGFTFLGAQHLLTVGRPEGLAANLADLLTKGVLALFGKAFLLFFCLLMGFCTVSIAKSLSCAVRIKLLTALFADTLRVLMTVIRRPAFHNRLVGVLKHKAFFIGGKAAFIGLKVRSDGLSQHCMTEIFLSA